MNKFLTMPLGWCFTPDDEQLIKLHLTPKVGGLPLLWDGFAEKDLYGVGAPPPWEMFRDIDSSVYPPSAYYHTETNKEGTITRKTVYVFTKLKAAASAAAANSKKGVRVSRRVGGGTWSGKSKPKKIIDSATGDIIGHTKQLAFEHEGVDVDENVVGHWIMHEYSLTAGWGSDFVLCKITRCTTHPAPAPIVEEDYFFEEVEEEVILEPEPKKQKTSVVASASVPDSNLELTEIEKLWMHSDADDKLYAKELEKMLGEEDCTAELIDKYNMFMNITDGDPDFLNEWERRYDQILDDHRHQQNEPRSMEKKTAQARDGARV